MEASGSNDPQRIHRVQGRCWRGLQTFGTNNCQIVVTLVDAIDESLRGKSEVQAIENF